MATRVQLCDSNSPPKPDRTGLRFINANSHNVIAVYMDQQNREMDQFIKLQSENLRLMIMNQTTLKASILLRQKDEEIERAMRKKLDLEFTLQKLENDKLTWQKLASDKAATATQLQTKIEEVRAVVVMAAEDNESCTGPPETVAPANALMMCRNCGSDWGTRIMFLPCRHFCCCSNCDVGFEFCMICNSPRKHSIEVLLS